MKRVIFKRFLSVLALSVVGVGIFVNSSNGSLEQLASTLQVNHKIGSGSTVVNPPSGITTDPTQYVGYGYNVTGGKGLYEPDALMLNNPILDVEDAGIRNNIKVFDGSKTEYQSSSSKSTTEIAEKYGSVLGGGGGIQGKISMVNVDVNAKFNMTNTSSWSKISNEEYSYYTIFAGNRPVVLQMEHQDLSDHLSARFKKDILKVSNEADARNLFDKYGTHLLTGYTLGGIFEMTNYYATNSDTYQKESNTSFATQVGVAIGSYANGNLDFSFTNNYGYKDNNKFATNSYKCTTYGGLSFPGLTIDQAFSWYETLTGAGYVYQLWTDSINAGKNLVIVGVPQSSKMVPLWDLLPATGGAIGVDKTRDTLIKAYNKVCAESYSKYKDENKSHFLSNITNDIIANTKFTYEDKGFNYSIKENNKYITTRINGGDIATTEAYDVKPDSYIYMDYNNYDFLGQDVMWSSESKDVVITDARNGVIHIKPDAIDGDQFTLNLSVNGVNLFARKFKIAENSFAGGSGTELSPYLISNVDNFKEFMKSEEAITKKNYYKLISDLDFTGETTAFSVIGDSKANSFKGVFDGGYHVLRRYPICRNNTSSNKLIVAPFGVNDGVIKNVTFDYADDKLFLPNTVNTFGGIVGFNDVDGVIENCHVNKLEVIQNNSSIDNIENPFTTTKKTLAMGGIASYSKGDIIRCTTNTVALISRTYMSLKDVCIGGIVGKLGYLSSDHTPIVSQCEVGHGTIYCNRKENNDYYFTYLGGIAGSVNNADVKQCVVDNINNTNTSESTKAEPINYGIGYVKKDGGQVSQNFYLGLLTGALSGKCNFSEISIHGNCSVQNSLKTDTNDTVALLIGGDKKVGATPTFEKVYLELGKIGDEEFKIYKTQTKDDLVTTYIGLYVDVIFAQSVYEMSFTGEGVWRYLDGKPYIADLGVKAETMSIDYSKTRTTFFIGDSFTYSNISVHGVYTNGEEFNETSVYVDDRNYDPNVIGQQQIFVSCYGVELSYWVQVVPAGVERIYVVEKQDKDYCVGDSEIDLNTVEVHRVYEDGKDEIVNFDPKNPDSFTYEIMNDGKLIEGNNTVIFKCGDQSYAFNVDAIAYEADYIEIKKDSAYDALINQIYTIGTDDVNFDNLTIVVHYKNNIIAPREVSGAECEFTYSKIHSGENKVLVTYDVTATTKQDNEIVLTGAVVSDNTVQEFIDLMATYDPNGTMAEKFDVLTKAQKLLDKIGEYVPANLTLKQNYSNARTLFIAAKAEYNGIANDINSGYEQAIKISGCLNYAAVEQAGFITLSAIIAWLIKRI